MRDNGSSYWSAAVTQITTFSSTSAEHMNLYYGDQGYSEVSVYRLLQLIILHVNNFTALLLCPNSHLSTECQMFNSGVNSGRNHFAL